MRLWRRYINIMPPILQLTDGYYLRNFYDYEYNYLHYTYDNIRCAYVLYNIGLY